jgi:hypothetical protein
MSFAAACRKADKKERRKRIDPRIARLRKLMANDVLLDRAWRELNQPRGAAEATLQAAEFLMQVGDAQCWRKWFDAHSANERAGILRHLDSIKRGKP